MTTSPSTRWQIATDQLGCLITLEGGGLRWQLLTNNGLTFAPTCLAALAVDGLPLLWHSAQAHMPAPQNNVRRLEIEASDAARTVRLDVVIELFEDMPFIRTSAILVNTSQAFCVVTDGEIVRLAPSAGQPLTLFHVEQFSWPYRDDFFSQHQLEFATSRAPTEIRMGSFPSHYCAPSSCAWFALRASEREQRGGRLLEGPGIVAGIEFNGKSRLCTANDAGQPTVTSSIDDLAHPLGPGETFELPACFVGCFAGDWDEAGYVTQRFAEAHVHPPMPDNRYPWVQYNSWKYGQDINEAQQLMVIERCAELGLEVFVLDLGWARQIGDWRPNPAKFPRGLRPLAERAHELGMKFGVHLALAQMHPDAPAARAHPEWLIHTGDDYFGAGPICLGHTPCREWLAAEILRLIDEEGLDYIIQDGEDMVKRCTRSDHTHAPNDSNYANSTLGIDLLIDHIRTARPQLVLENCEDGGCMLTYRMARMYHTSITVDNIATYATRQGVYGASYPFSPRYSVRYMQDDPTSYTLRSSIFGGPLILMQRITDWDEQQMAETRAAIMQYKQLRGLIRNAKVIHLLPPQSNAGGEGWGWDAIGAVAPDKARAVVMVYRAQGGRDSQLVCPRGLLAQQRYRVSYADSQLSSEHSGEELATTGLTVTLPPLHAEIMFIDAL